MELRVLALPKVGTARHMGQGVRCIEQRRRHGNLHDRRDHRSLPSGCHRRRKKNGAQAIGHSRGGPTTKIHASVDALGNPTRLLLTEGQTHDITQAQALVAGLRNANIIADKGYDSKAVVSLIESQGCVAVIPARKCSTPRPIDWNLYKERALVEGFFQKIKRNRRIAMRFEKLAAHFLAMVTIAALLVWLA